MKNLTILALVLITTATWAQNVSQTSAKLAYSHSIALSQSFYWNGGTISEISIPVFSRYQPTNHPATVYIISGSGSNPFNGNVLLQKNVSISSLNKFYPEIFLSTLSVVQIENLWLDIQNLIDNDSLLFNDLKTIFLVNQSFPPDSMTLVIELDTSISYLGYKYITAFGNCFPNGNCPSPILDPYEGGMFYFGYSFFNPSLDSDLAFEVLDLNTGMSSVKDIVGLSIFPNPSSGDIYFDMDVSEIDYEILNSLGALVKRGSVKKADTIHLENPGLYFFRATGVPVIKLIVH
jgi:hypothetical protein